MQMLFYGVRYYFKSLLKEVNLLLQSRILYDIIILVLYEGRSVIMKFKSNYTLAYLLLMAVVFIIMAPIITVMLLLMDKDLSTAEILAYMSIFVIVYLVLVVAVNIINLIIWIFAKAKLTVYKERITYADHTVRLQGMEMNCEREIKLEDVGYIHFDYGALSRYGGGSPCILSLFDMHNDLIMEIKNPSFIATLIIIKRCKQADKNIVRKWFVILCAVLYSIAAIVLLFTALI